MLKPALAPSGSSYRSVAVKIGPSQMIVQIALLTTVLAIKVCQDLRYCDLVKSRIEIKQYQ